MLTEAPKGTKDIFGSAAKQWVFIEETIRKVCKDFGVDEIRTPIFEHTELFLRGVGETTDIVQKEMYTFKDKADRSLTLRPESTAGIARAFIENGMHNNPQPTKLFYIAPTFRYENTQKGRQRQFHQFGVEMLGSYSPAQDAEVISIAAELLNRLGIKNVELRINSLGGTECRQKFNHTLKTYIGKNIDKLCPDCRDRFWRNPLRVLDCKEERCRSVMDGAPNVLDSLGDECSAHFQMVKSILTEMDIPFVIDPLIVRGLDYYTRTVFEFVSKDIGAQGTVCGGGRYDNLIEECGGNATGAVGFGLGMERLLLVMEAENGTSETKNECDIYIGSMGEYGIIRAEGIVYKLRKQGITAACDSVGRSVKAQMKYANKIGARYSVILGDEELMSDSAKVKDMETGEQVEVKVSGMAEEIAKILGK